ncbi:MAG: hypothetical protein JWN77_3217, partial [Frankiales bacterium]|nr:hypothetical protein [Frankiales bacterium]
MTRPDDGDSVGVLERLLAAPEAIGRAVATIRQRRARRSNGGSRR